MFFRLQPLPFTSICPAWWTFPPLPLLNQLTPLGVQITVFRLEGILEHPLTLYQRALHVSGISHEHIGIIRVNLECVGGRIMHL